MLWGIFGGTLGVFVNTWVVFGENLGDKKKRLKYTAQNRPDGSQTFKGRKSGHKQKENSTKHKLETTTKHQEFLFANRASALSPEKPRKPMLLILSQGLHILEI